MALPFFRKSKDKTPGSAQKNAPARPHAMDAPPTESLFTMNMGTSGIVVEETSGSPQSLVDEAAILYASGQADTVEHLLKDILDKGDRRAWLMLFDLYGIQNREKEFEQLALDYAMRFETSPPVWQKIGGNGAAKLQQAQATSLELPGLLDKKATATLREGVAATAKNAVVRIDFSGIAMVDEAGADECARILAAARKAKRKLQVSGVDRLIALLQDLNRATHSRAVHWLLLLELYQTLGQEENFEDLAVDYAVRFEVSPPSWSEVQAAEVVQAPPAESYDDALQLSGEITPANDSALQQFGSYAATHNDVLVDLTQVTRVDYASVSQFISVLMQCLGSGKTITLRGHNALIHELFRVMGIDQLVQLVPHHPD
ncbi:MAG: STAS domain-containing protein [Thiobacillus sp.]|nr:STAS domain-containing protein [Thiobacillus sp.]